MRASDIPVVSPVHASMVTSGAASKTIALIKAAHIPFYSEGSKGFYRASDRPAPYNLLAHLNDVANTAKAKAATPPDYLTWGSESDLPKGIKVTTIGAQFSGGHTTAVAVHQRQLPQPQQLRARRRPVPGHQRAGAAGQGGRRGLPRPGRQPGAPDAAWSARATPCSSTTAGWSPANWHKDKAPDSQIKLTTKKGDALKVPAGHTWIELVPVDGGNVTFKK